MAGRMLALFRRATVGVSSYRSCANIRVLSSIAPPPPASPTPEEPPEPTQQPELFFTTQSASGVEVDKSYSVNLKLWFKNHTKLCYEKHNKWYTCFSDLSLDIFRKIVSIQYKQSLGNVYFKLESSKILVKLEGTRITDVAIPIEQVTEDKSIYQDRVIGPFTVLLHNQLWNRKSYYCAEILDLMKRALRSRWWSSLDEIFGHPLFWSIDKKMSSLTLMKIWMTTSKSLDHHGLSNIPRRVRHITPAQFKRAYSRNSFYQARYLVSEEGAEIQVKEYRVWWDWRTFFLGKGRAFHVNFFLGSSKCGTQSYLCENLYINRNIIVHWGSESNDALSANYQAYSAKDALILLDARFKFSLSIYYALKDLNVELWDVT